MATSSKQDVQDHRHDSASQGVSHAASGAFHGERACHHLSPTPCGLGPLASRRLSSPCPLISSPRHRTNGSPRCRQTASRRTAGSGGRRWPSARATPRRDRDPPGGRGLRCHCPVQMSAVSCSVSSLRCSRATDGPSVRSSAPGTLCDQSREQPGGLVPARMGTFASGHSPPKEQGHRRAHGKRGERDDRECVRVRDPTGIPGL